MGLGLMIRVEDGFGTHDWGLGMGFGLMIGVGAGFATHD